ncbi:MAG: HPr family phosphocarrier protein [Clostridia bacterium]
MKSFKYIIKDEFGIHVRPAGLLVKEAKKLNSKIFLEKDDAKIEATKLMAIMSMGVKQGDEILISVDGIDEDRAITAMKTFFENNL